MILLLSITLPIIILTLFLLLKTKKAAALPPGPPALPLIGNLHQLGTATNLHLYLHQLSQKYGPIMHVKLGSVPAIIVSSPKLAKEVMKTQDSVFCSRPKSLGQQKLSYNSSDIIFSPYNDYFKEMRKIATIHLLSLKKVKSFLPIREEEVARMITKVSGTCSVVNMNEVALSISSCLISRIAFGKKLDHHGLEMTKFEELLEGAQSVAVAFYMTDYLPAFSWVDKLTGRIGKLNTAAKKLDSYYQELIDEHLDRTRQREEEDILDVLIQLKEQQNLGWDNIKALLMNIFIAGTDTASSVIVWTMTALIKSPAIMKKLQHEIRSRIGQKGKVNEDDLPNLPYLKAVVNETMRLYAPAPVLPRETLAKCTLEGYEIQAKTVVYVNTYAVARDPEYWKNPNDFVPERFLNNDIDVKGQDFGFLPFGSGRRICPGLVMGLLNVELTVANLLYSFDWALPSGINPEDVNTDPAPGLAVHKKTSLLLVPKKHIMSSIE